MYGLRDDENAKNNRYQWLKFSVVGIELAVSVIAGLYLGDKLDEWLGMETPVFTLLGLVAGMVAGFSLLLWMLRTKDDGDVDKKEGNDA